MDFGFYWFRGCGGLKFLFPALYVFSDGIILSTFGFVRMFVWTHLFSVVVAFGTFSSFCLLWCRLCLRWLVSSCGVSCFGSLLVSEL